MKLSGEEQEFNDFIVETVRTAGVGAVYNMGRKVLFGAVRSASKNISPKLFNIFDDGLIGIGGLTRAKIDKYGLFIKFDDIDFLGSTDMFGNIKIREGLKGEESKTTYKHELVHKFFSPKKGPFIKTRAKINQFRYGNSQLWRFFEETAAETYGSGSLKSGLAWMHANRLSYGITYSGMATEASIISGTGFGGYAGYRLINEIGKE